HAGHLRWSSLLFGHGADDACRHATQRGVCINPLELCASVHDVKIALLWEGADECHRPVAVRIHGIGAIKGGGVILSSQSGDVLLVKGAGRGRERGETDETARDELTPTVGAGAVPAVAMNNVVSRHAEDAIGTGPGASRKGWRKADNASR